MKVNWLRVASLIWKVIACAVGGGAGAYVALS